MGFFADLPKNVFTQTTDLVWTSIKIAYESVYNAPILLATEKLDIYYDECNFTYTSDFGVLHLRNKYCQLPPPPPPPIPGDREIYDKPSYCNINSLRWRLEFTNHSQYAVSDYSGSEYITQEPAFGGSFVGNGLLSVKVIGLKLQNEAGQIFSPLNSTINTANAILTLSITKTINIPVFGGGVFVNISKNIDCYINRDNTQNFPYNAQIRPIYAEDIAYFTPCEVDGMGYYQISPRMGAYYFFQAKVEQIFNSEIQNDLITPTTWVSYQATGLFIEHIGSVASLVICDQEKPPEAPPPPQKKDKNMNCCDELRALLKLTLKRIGSLPANVPDNFAKQNPLMINIESLAELMLWQMQQLDALSGAYPIEIEIEDSDLVQAGNQKQKVSLPNQAEALAELIGMILTIKRDTHANLITSIKAMGEAGMSKQLTVKVLDVALANAEYLGYKLEQKKKEIPSLFTPGGKDITETLKEKNIEIITYENTDKKDLQDNLKTLLEFAARWNAQNWRRVGSNAAKDLLQHLLVKPEETAKATKENDQDDFNKFTEEIERGFIDVAGTTTDAQPWGRPYKERPKIKELKNEKGRYGKDD